jgi:hypothetical protein
MLTEDKTSMSPPGRDTVLVLLFIELGLKFIKVDKAAGIQ